MDPAALLGGSDALFRSGLALLLVGAGLSTLRWLPMVLWDQIERHVVLRVDVPDSDPIFHYFVSWFAASQHAGKARFLSVKTETVNEYWRMNQLADVSRVIIGPGYGLHFLWIEGRLTLLYRWRTEAKDGSPLAAAREFLTLRIFGGTKGMVDRLFTSVWSSALTPEPGTVRVRHIKSGEWSTPVPIRGRTIDSLFFGGNEGNETLKDVRRFLQEREWYSQSGIPYRRGYLFEGPPGNGKSSLVTAVATECGLQIHVINVGTAHLDDIALLGLLRQVPPRSIVLVEDLDKVFDGEKTHEKAGVTFSGVQNAIDGVGSPEGVLFFFTSNYPEKIQAELVRTGRVDVKVHIGNPTEEQAARFFMRFFGGAIGPVPLDDRAFCRRDAPWNMASDFGMGVTSRGMSMSDVQHVCVLYRNSPMAAVAAVTEERFRAQAQVASV